MSKKLNKEFFERTNALEIGKELLGKVFHTNFEGKHTSGIIVECEAYVGEADKAAHVYGGRRTKRTEAMYGPAGHAYVYLCYGVHHLINFVTHSEGVPHAVLLRALEPVDGIDIMMERRKIDKMSNRITQGPGNLTKAMGIDRRHNGHDLLTEEMWVEDVAILENDKIAMGRRIGVDYAEEDALLPYRFWIKDNPFVSKYPPSKFSNI